MKKLTVWLLAMAITLPMLAQGPQGVNKEKHKQVRKQMKAYAEQNILPVVIENRMDFESILSADEKETLADLRERQQKLKAQAMARRAAMREKRQGDADFRPSDEDRDARKALGKEMRLIKTAAYEIIDEHEDFFLAMENEMADKKETWKKDMKAIMEAAIGDEERREHFGSRGRHSGHHGPDGHRGPGMHAMREMFAPVAFVLLDPSNPRLPDDEVEPIAIYPNPTAARQLIDLELRKSGKVKVELIDAEGKLLETLYEENLSAGSNQIAVDLSAYNGSQYFYKITTPDGSETKRVLKNPK